MAKKRHYDFVKENVDLLEYARDKVQLKKVGNIYIGKCPFHREKTPSFNIHPKTNSFYCWGCGKGGSIIDFVIYENGFDTPEEALEFIKEEFGFEFKNDEEMALAYIRNKIKEYRNKDIEQLGADEINLTVSCICRNYLKIIKNNDKLNKFFQQEIDYIEKIYKYIDMIMWQNNTEEINVLVDKVTNKLMSRKNELENA